MPTLYLKDQRRSMSLEVQESYPKAEAVGNLTVFNIKGNRYRLIVDLIYPIDPIQVKIGLWNGSYQQQEMLWLWWWDLDGNLLLIGQEQVAIERHRTEQECLRADAAEQELAELRSLLQQQ